MGKEIQLSVRARDLAVQAMLDQNHQQDSPDPCWHGRAHMTPSDSSGGQVANDRRASRS